MNPKHSKLEHQHEELEVQTNDLQQTSGTGAGHEFESVEQMLRANAADTNVPEAVEQRLSQSVQQQPKTQSSWWSRWRKR